MSSGRIPSIEGGIQPTIFDAKGDLLVATAADTPARLAVGTDGQVLKADSSTSTGLAWGAAGSSFVGCRLRNTANQTFSNNTWSAVTFDAESLDTDAFHSTTSNTSRVTIPTGKGGKYLFIAQVGWATNTTSSRELAYYKNGASVTCTGNITSSSGLVSHSTSLIIDLVATDYIELFALQNSGGNLATRDNETWLNCVYLGA